MKNTRRNRKAKAANKNNVRNITLFGNLHYSFILDSLSFCEIDPDTVSDNAYCGRTSGTVYQGGSDYTDWGCSLLVSKNDLKKGYKETKFGRISLSLLD